MLNTILNNSQTITKQSPSSSFSHLNPQKPTQKTSQSSEHQKDQLSLEEYTKLQALLQSREASLREHAKHQYQLKLFIEDLEEKNKALEKNIAKIMDQYKTEVTAVRKENQGLRKLLKKLEAQNVQIKRQCQAIFLVKQNEKCLFLNRLTPTPEHNRAQSQSVIKVIESVDHKQSFRESQPNFKLSPFTLSGKESPILASQQSRRNFQSQSKQKLEVTIKSSRFLEKPKSSTPGRNQKHILGQNDFKREECMERERSIKKLMELKKMNDGNDDELKNKKILLEKGSSKKISQQKRIQSNNSYPNPDEQTYKRSEKSSTILDEIVHQKIIIKNFSKEFNQEMKRSMNSGNSKKLSSEGEKRSKQMSRSKHEQHDLIKLGHYANVHTERTKYQQNSNQ